MAYLEKFADKVSKLVKDEWYSIKPVNSEDWEREFEEYVESALNGKDTPRFYTCRSEATRFKKSKLREIDPKEKFKMCYDIHNMMEGLWLEGRKRIKAIEQEGSLKLDDVVEYGMRWVIRFHIKTFRLRSTTYSPPENINTTDPTHHNDIFPQYHFLGVPNMDQMHASRLFGLNTLAVQVKPPKITFEQVSEKAHKMVLTCDISGATIHFQTLRENPNIRCPQTGRPMVYSTEPVVYDDKKNYQFKSNCNPFTVRAWSVVEGLKDSRVVEATYGGGKEEVKEYHFGLMLDR